MHDFKVDKATGYHHFKFADMQGIQVKEGSIFNKIILQFFDGRNYVIRVNKRDMKHLPNQHENSKKIVNLRDMDNEILKKNKKENRLMGFNYVITLVIFLSVAFYFGFKYIQDSFILMVVLIIGTGILHFILFIIALLYLSIRKDRPFKKEYETVMKKYRETDDAYELFENLSNLKNKPKSVDTSNAFNLSMSTALYRTNQLDEAFVYLNAIETSDEIFLKAIEEQRAVFEGKEIPDLTNQEKEATRDDK